MELPGGGDGVGGSGDSWGGWETAAVFRVAGRGGASLARFGKSRRRAVRFGSLSERWPRHKEATGAGGGLYAVLCPPLYPQHPLSAGATGQVKGECRVRAGMELRGQDEAKD